MSFPTPSVGRTDSARYGANLQLEKNWSEVLEKFVSATAA